MIAARSAIGDGVDCRPFTPGQRHSLDSGPLKAVMNYCIPFVTSSEICHDSLVISRCEDILMTHGDGSEWCGRMRGRVRGGEGGDCFTHEPVLEHATCTRY